MINKINKFIKKLFSQLQSLFLSLSAFFFLSFSLPFSLPLPLPSLSRYLQMDDAVLVYYRASDKDYKYLDMECDLEELIRDSSLTFDK